MRDWKLDYNNIAQMSPEELARRRAEFDKQKRSRAATARRDRRSLRRHASAGD